MANRTFTGFGWPDVGVLLKAMHVFPLHTGLRWTGVLTLIMATLMLYGHPLNKELPLVVIRWPISSSLLMRLSLARP